MNSLGKIAFQDARNRWIKIIPRWNYYMLFVELYSIGARGLQLIILFYFHQARGQIGFSYQILVTVP
jgi:hypothetical protein